MGLLGFAWMETANMYYLNMSLFLAYATLYPDAAFILYFIIRVKAKWLAWADGVFLALAVVGSLLDRNIPMALMPILAVLNYLLFFCPAAALSQKLAERGVLIRDCSNYHGLGPGWYRAAVRLEHENTTFLKILEEVL